MMAVLLHAGWSLAQGTARSTSEPPPPDSTTYEYSPYEKETIALTLERLGLEQDPDPEGKIVERLDVVTLEVFEPRDPAPGFLNFLHTTSRRYTVEREVLVKPGQVYRKVLVDESARNLRALLQLSLVICIPVRATRPDRVGLLIITKDVWSLRLNSDIRYSSGGLDRLILQPSETNVAGTHHTVTLRYELDPAAWSLGVQYRIPRMTEHQLSAFVQGNVIVNRESGAPEGSFGGVSLGRPLLSSRTPWSWLTTTAWLTQTTRRFVNAKLATFDANITPENDRIPFAYNTRRMMHRTRFTRSFGWAVKNDLSFGVEYDAREYDVPGLSAPAAAVQEFKDERMPSSSTRLSPFVLLEAYTTDFVRVLDFETLGLQEDYRLGHSLILKLYPASADFGSTRTLFGVFAAAQYTVPFVDGLARVGIESENEMEPDRVSDASIHATWRVITPRLGFGRLLVDSMLLRRYRNFMNRSSSLGGGGRLRGYPTNYFVGHNMVANNVELRTHPVQIFNLQLGAATFYDVGGVWDAGDSLDLHQSAGVGMRALFPQLDRVTFRVDVGFPLAKGGLPHGVAPMSFFVAFEQAFPMPSIRPPL